VRAAALHGLIETWRKRVPDLEDERGNLAPESRRVRLVDVDKLGSNRLAELAAAHDHLAAAVHRYRFRSRKDRAIVRAIVNGCTHRRIMRRLSVGVGRIQRVLREVRLWRD
jgi:FixJ family two-component response regulator